MNLDNIEILSARLINSSYTLMQCKIKNLNTGAQQNLQFVIPEDDSNVVWNKILENTTYEQLIIEFEDRMKEVESRAKHEKESAAAQKRSAELGDLFAEKTFILSTKLSKEFTREEKRMIRKAPNKMILNFVVTKILLDKFNDNKDISNFINDVIKTIN